MSEPGTSPVPAERRGGRRRKLLRVFVVCAFAGLAGLAQAAAAPVRIVGSDLLGLEFSKALYGLAGRQGVQLALAFDGTKAGLGELQAGRAAAALLVVAPDLRPALADYDVRRVGSYVVFVWAAEACPLTSVDFDQLASIFGAGTGPATLRWRDLGQNGDVGDAVVVAMAPETGVGLTFEFFRHRVLKAAPVRRSVVRFNESAEIAREFVRSPAGVALAGVAPAARAGIRVLPVRVDRARPAVAPTADAVRAGEYALQVPLERVVRRDAPTEARALLGFVYSDEATELLARAEVMPVPADERARHAAELRGK